MLLKSAIEQMPATSMQRWYGNTIYQINKCIGAMAVTLHGKVDGILLGGGMVYNKGLVAQIKEACEWIAPGYPYPGEFEMEAMASGAIRASRKEEVKTYTGVPVWAWIPL
ncbi:MAG: hypothetical protein V8R80_07450 [Eubacterium sp.]